MRKHKLSLINYEGDSLRAVNNEEGMVDIIDQYGVTVKSLEIADLFSFFDGYIKIEDSNGKVWSFVDEHKDSKPSWSSVYQFISTCKL